MIELIDKNVKIAIIKMLLKLYNKIKSLKRIKLS